MPEPTATRGWYAIRRLTNKNIEVLGGPYKTKGTCYAAQNTEYDTPFGWNIEFWTTAAYKELLPRLLFMSRAFHERPKL